MMLGGMATRLRLGKSIRPQQQQRFLLQGRGTSEQRVVAAAGPTNATEQMVRLINERLKKRTRIRFDQREERSHRAPRGKPVFCGKGIDHLFAAGAAIRELVYKGIERPAMTQGAPCIACDECMLLNLEKMEQPAVFRDFIP